MLRWLGNSRTQRISVLLLLMAIAAQLAEFIQLEGIIGAFLAGIAAKRAFQHTPMEEALDIVSNTLFIPAFFVTAGFLIDFHIFAETLITHPLLVIGIVGGLILGKYLAGRIAGSLLGYQRNDGLLMFAMSVPQVAATLAVALVAYAAVNGSGARLIDEPMLNATIVLVIITSALGLILANRYAKRIVDSNTRVLSNEAESAVPVAAASGELPQ
jgi:Kef-type K+ transport system membrane component KefB